MKKAARGIIALLMIISLTLTASAEKINIKIDGKNENKEWFDALSENLFKESEQKGNGISTAFMKYLFDTSSENRIYFMVSVWTKKIEDEGLLKVKFSVNGSEMVTVYAENEETLHPLINNDDYLVDACLKTETPESYVLEVKFDDKSGLGRAPSWTLQVGDEQGILSDARRGSFENPLFTTLPSTAEITTVKKSADKTVKTEKATERTTRPTTTYKSHLTAKVTTEKITEKAEKDTPSKAAKKTEAEKTYSETWRSESVKASTTAPNTTADENSLFNESNLSRASIYKIAVCAGAVILFGILGLWAIRTRADADRAEKEEAPTEDTDSEDKHNNHGE